MVDFSIPLGTFPAYHGNLDATVFEVASPDTTTPANAIRTSEDWGVKVEWKVGGAFVPFLIDEFHLRVHIESIGPGLEALLPLAGPVVVNTLAAPLVAGERSYVATINVPAGTVPAGVYKIVTLVQLYDDAPAGKPYPIVATVEGPMLTFFDAA